MADYSRIYNLTVKDSLPTGNSGKVIKGAELDAELNAVASAISSKSDSNSPTFTGTPAAPTASFGTSTTQVATTAFVQAALQAIYPVGSVYINATSNTNPASIFGFGTWEAFGAGRVMVGLDAGDTDFDTLGETGGSKDAIVVEHNHTAASTSSSTSTVTDPGHTHPYLTAANKTLSTGGDPNQAWALGNTTINTTSNTTGITVATATTTSTTVANSGSSGTNANLQPYCVVRMWRRTA